MLELIIEEAEEVVAETTIIEIKNDDNYTFSNNVILWKMKKWKLINFFLNIINKS